MKGIEGKVAVVTGASRGIGRSIALKLAEEGADIVVNYRKDSSPLAELVEQIEKFGRRAVVVQGDVSLFDDARKIIQAAVENFQTVDILVNNAGITKDGLILRMKESDFDKVIEVNLKGTFNCIRHVSPIMVKKRSGKIINISSVVGITGNAGQANYSAAKAGIIGLTKSAARELAVRGINVNAIAPGFIKTSMTEVLSDKVKEGILSGIPLRRIGTAEDVAEAAAFLASAGSDYITGQVINIDGGMVM
ncbi:MAG: 3-oxoacyl-[acyl-carrier-protein] reductase [Clostridium sp.]|jgi:3-oxoacyl-[acyl-carrier protein] reductase|uniref:3-oxoacyl-[acyl-carrier-protein] reductase n=1 Tax=Clostridium sp. TaxID=1506 RepID=UPI0025C5E56A|nr:3-oxoacyl-[acyl-carrier-protein] reductase [Clostridium sp.]MCH3965568.1 3-oxoacyl-[acyl-carrier-protein] reductase [Clostridium sp.]MCI1716896.1 3-oxoacyl-[acyl-carrier-protein] reductase [Clostridium sp.]MCI1801174.1 3-oxoacyl-[acyl-carrier-protein] reductase [Clostridium sp.]MCI1815082.1 3-oxoacyl-[acyl-carrier-protein] reductase [Clostridium sp.]MCI1871985.1 3-oxoacyl-[acyl-carrier-protein] reductase [Clostridium sp.]